MAAGILEQSIALAHELKALGVDLVDASSGGAVPGAKIPIAPGFQVPFASAIRKATGILTGAVGKITQPDQANQIITAGDADIVFLAREMLREPYWALNAQRRWVKSRLGRCSMATRFDGPNASQQKFSAEHFRRVPAHADVAHRVALACGAHKDLALGGEFPRPVR